MDYRRANRAYLYMILSTIALVVVLSLWYLNGGPEISILVNNIISEGVVLIPAVAAVLYSGDRLSVLVPIRKIKLTSALLTVIYIILLFPLVTFVNAISMLFVENTVSAISDDVLAMPIWLMLLSIGILGPLVEEIVFRGVLLQSYQRTGRIIGSILLSSILFGMMHMNFNQFAYGAVMGIMLALLVEATGTVTSSFIAHALFNSIEVIMMYVSSDAIDEATEMAEDYLESMNFIYYAILFVAAVIFTVGAVMIVRKIAQIEEREEFFDNMPKCKKKGYKLITLPLIIAMILAVAYMIFSASL